MPSPPPPPQPSKRDLPKLALSVFLGAPTPKQHTLKQVDEEVWYGTIAKEDIAFGVMQYQPTEAPEKPKPRLGDAAEPEPEKPFDLDESVFALRKKTCDARSYYCAGPKVTLRAFEIDWSRCNTERFRNFIGREDDSSSAQEYDTELAEVKQELCKHRSLINTVYSYYCVLGESHDRYVIGAHEFQALIRDLDLADPLSKGCRPGDLDNIFVSTNVEERAVGTLSQEQRTLNEVNADRALMRFEFLQALVRLAIAKYVKSGKTKDVSEALEMFMAWVQQKVPPEAAHTSDTFRRARLYCRAVHTVFVEHEKSLRAIFEHYSLGGDAQGITMAGRRLSLGEWETMLDDCGLYDDAFHRRDGALCFIWSQPLVTDEAKRACTSSTSPTSTSSRRLHASAPLSRCRRQRSSRSATRSPCRTGISRRRRASTRATRCCGRSGGPRRR